MSVALVNYVRNIYWNDRENLELEILDSCLKKLGMDSKIFYLNEDNSDGSLKILMENSDAIIFSCDFNVNDKIIRKIYELSEKVKKK